MEENERTKVNLMVPEIIGFNLAPYENENNENSPHLFNNSATSENFSPVR